MYCAHPVLFSLPRNILPARPDRRPEQKGYVYGRRCHGHTPFALHCPLSLLSVHVWSLRSRMAHHVFRATSPNRGGDSSDRILGKHAIRQNVYDGAATDLLSWNM